MAAQTSSHEQRDDSCSQADQRCGTVGEALRTLHANRRIVKGGMIIAARQGCRHSWMRGVGCPTPPHTLPLPNFGSDTTLRHCVSLELGLFAHTYWLPLRLRDARRRELHSVGKTLGVGPPCMQRTGVCITDVERVKSVSIKSCIQHNHMYSIQHTAPPHMPGARGAQHMPRALRAGDEEIMKPSPPTDSQRPDRSMYGDTDITPHIIYISTPAISPKPHMRMTTHRQPVLRQVQVGQRGSQVAVQGREGALRRKAELVRMDTLILMTWGKLNLSSPKWANQRAARGL